jgi:RNA polymerase subunit RPABC4/transcription elongation factor Spt4
MKRVCRQCKVFVEEGNCQLCKNADFATSWQGRINILEPGKSFIAKKVEIDKEGDYAIKVR